MAYFERLDFNSVNWDDIWRTFSDRTVYQTSAWLSFVAESQQAEPVLAALREGNCTLGYFTGLIVRKSRFRILGSPFPGWTTPYMGFNILPGVSRRTAVEALSHFAFHDLGCIHLELVNRDCTLEEVRGLGFEYDTYSTATLDLTQTEEGLLTQMSHDCRGSIRSGVKRGVTVEESDDARFADDYYEQLREVFARQSLVPSYGVGRVRLLIKHLHPAGRLLMLRARDLEGQCIATGIFVGADQEMYFWGGASRHEYQLLRPNEAIHWYAIKYWKKKGARLYDPGGTTHFKRKFGGTIVSVMRITKSRYRFLSGCREVVRQLIKTRQHLLARWPGA